MCSFSLWLFQNECASGVLCVDGRASPSASRGHDESTSRFAPHPRGNCCPEQGSSSPAPAPVPVFWEPEQSVTPAGVSSRESRDPTGDGRLLSEKDLNTVDRLLLRVIQSWRLCRWKSVEGQSKTDSDCPSRERNLLPLPPLSVAEALPWHQSEGNVDLLTDYANFNIEGINHLYGSPGKRLRKNPPLSQKAAQRKIFDKIERMYVRLNVRDVTFDQKDSIEAGTPGC